MTKAHLVYPHQLFETKKLPSKDSHVYLVEDPLFFSQYNFHKKKLILHRASMKYYQDHLESNGYKTTYVELNALTKSSEIAGILNRAGITEISYFDLVDDWLEQFITQGFSEYNITKTVLESPGFICSREFLDNYFLPLKKQNKKPLLLDFYKKLRIKYELLIKDGKPLGGQWSLDAENRKKIPRGLDIPEAYIPKTSSYVDEAHSYVSKHFPRNYGSDQNFEYAITHQDAHKALKHFLNHKLALFGPYEDTVQEDENVLFHSVISPYLNNGLITPDEVISETIKYYEAHPELPLSSVEGFVRQVLGWREYMRGVYIHYGRAMRTSNVLQAHTRLSNEFWTGQTGILPVDNSIRKALDTAYLHHIPRLMIMGNFMNLCGVHPDDVYRWFMELFIDAYDWVMVPNVYAMALYADGGTITTKPYISGSNYIVKMSDFKKGGWSETWDALFWNFVGQHQELLTKEGRMHFVMVQYSKKSDAEKQEYKKVSEEFITNILGKKKY